MTKIENLFNLCLLWLLVIFFVGLVEFRPKLYIAVFLIDVWFFSQPHVISTFFKVATFKRFSKLSLLVIFIILLLLLTSVYWVLGSDSLFTIYFFWQWFHYFRQNYGIAISERIVNRKIESFFLHWMPIVALLTLISKGPLSFLNYYISFPALPLGTPEFIKIYEASFIIWILFQINLMRRKNFNFYCFTHSLSSYFLYYWVYIKCEQYMMGWLGMTFYHNMQYLIFNWNKKGFISSYFKKRNMIFFYFTMISLSALVYGMLKGITFFINSPYFPIGVILIFALNMLHYLCDTVIWKEA